MSGKERARARMLAVVHAGGVPLGFSAGELKWRRTHGWTGRGAWETGGMGWQFACYGEGHYLYGPVPGGGDLAGYRVKTRRRNRRRLRRN